MVKNLTANAGDIRGSGSDPWVGKILWRRKWQFVSVFLPRESYGQRAWRATVHRVAKSQTRLKQLGTGKEVLPEVANGGLWAKCSP